MFISKPIAEKGGINSTFVLVSFCCNNAAKGTHWCVKKHIFVVSCSWVCGLVAAVLHQTMGEVQVWFVSPSIWTHIDVQRLPGTYDFYNSVQECKRKSRNIWCVLKVLLKMGTLSLLPAFTWVKQSYNQAEVNETRKCSFPSSKHGHCGEGTTNHKPTRQSTTAIMT